MEIRGFLGCLLIGRSDKDLKNIPKIYKTRRIYQNHIDKAMLIESSLIFAFKLVALLACCVILKVEVLEGPGVLTINFGKAPPLSPPLHIAWGKQLLKLRTWGV
jgi:hypothetical protein